MKWIMKDCPRCGEKMVLLVANIEFRPSLPFNLHCEECGHILEYGNKQFSVDAKLFENKELADLLAVLLK